MSLSLRVRLALFCVLLQTEISEDEMEDCAETLAPFIPLLDQLRAQEVYDPEVTLPDPAKARSYVAGLLVKCNRHTHGKHSTAPPHRTAQSLSLSLSVSHFVHG